MATPIWNGTNLLGYLLEDYPADIVIDDIGIGAATMYYSSQFDSAAGLVLNIDQHPDYPWLKRKSANISREEAGLAKIRINFEGIPPDEDPDGPPKLTYSLEVASASEPIDTHPRFVSHIGGKKGAPINNAQFDKDGKFTGFPATLADKVTANPKAGVKSYLSDSVIYTETRLITSGGVGSLFDKLGLIDTPPTSDVLPVITGRTWLMISGTVGEVGEGLKMVRKWRMSGQRAWDTIIYGTA